jgi:carbon-monoxide dehydrogenase medium subunit
LRVAVDHRRAQTLAEALDACADDYLPYAGATELVAAMRMGLLRPEGIVSVRGVPELREIGPTSGGLRIGAAATHNDVARSTHVLERLPLLSQIVGNIGNPRVRAAGTIGGNLAFGEPRSDLITILAALDATVDLESRRGARSMSVEEFIVGPYETALEEDELLVGVEVPTEEVDIATFEKFVGAERPIVAASVVQRLKTWTVTVGAVGEELFIGRFDDLESIDPSAIAAEVDVVPDLAGGEAYKRHLAELAITRCVIRARVGVEGSVQA